MKLHKNLLLFGASALLLVACGDDTSTSEGASEEVDSLQKELEEANARIAELEQQLADGSEPEFPSETDDNIEEGSAQGLIGLNEEISFGDNTGELFKLTVTKATNNQDAFPEHMVNLDEYDTDRIVAISIDYENVGLPEGYRPSSHDFQAYTKDGVGLERISQQSGQDAISEGRKASTQIYFEFPEGVDDLESIELDYLDYGNVLATFELPIE